MRIATWNVNSIRARAARVGAWLDGHDVDVLAIQETKCKDEQFPTEPFTERGYEVVHHGVNQWNGVAIMSRVGCDDVSVGFAGQPTFGDAEGIEPRAIGATCGGVRVWSLYIPNGRAPGDPHLQYKLDFLDALADETRKHLANTPDAPLALCGDYNVAPFDEDVWDPEFFADKTHTSPVERAAFERLVDAGVTDVVRADHPGPGVYTFWDYTQLRFPKKQGMRIDFVLGSAALAGRVQGSVIDRDERKGKGASDHCPVVVDLSDV